MLTCYFLDGLGSNAYYPKAFTTALSRLGIDLIYLELPDNLANCYDWFQDMTDHEEKVYLAGFSLGADIANDLANHTRVDKLILLDGGLAVHDISKQSLEEEINDALAYLSSCQVTDLELLVQQEKEQAKQWTQDLEKAVRASYIKNSEGGYQLNLSPERVTALLTKRRNSWQDNKNSGSQVETLLLLADQPRDYLAVKKEAVAAYPNLKCHVISDASHQLYLDQPEKIAEAIADFLLSDQI